MLLFLARVSWQIMTLFVNIVREKAKNQLTNKNLLFGKGQLFVYNSSLLMLWHVPDKLWQVLACWDTFNFVPTRHLAKAGIVYNNRKKGLKGRRHQANVALAKKQLLLLLFLQPSKSRLQYCQSCCSEAAFTTYSPRLFLGLRGLRWLSELQEAACDGLRSMASVAKVLSPVWCQPQFWPAHKYFCK